jgi:hypothetical protein
MPRALQVLRPSTLLELFDGPEKQVAIAAGWIVEGHSGLQINQ